jgi:hypothetical protein
MTPEDVEIEDGAEDSETIVSFSTATQNEFFQHWWNNEGLDLFLSYYNTE